MFLVNLTPKELTPCKISHICRCAFNNEIGYKLVENFLFYSCIDLFNVNLDCYTSYIKYCIQ